MRHAERRPRRIVIHDAVIHPRDNDDEVECARTVLDQGNDRLTIRQPCLNDALVAAKRPGAPAAPSNVGKEDVTADSPCGLVYECRERLGVDTGRAPIAHDHGGRGTAAQRFALLDIGDVEKSKGGVRCLCRDIRRRYHEDSDGE